MKYAIKQDMDAQNPQDDGDTGLFLVANHRDFYVREPGEKAIPRDAFELIKKYRKSHWIFTIEAYIHSGVVLAFSSQGNFPDRRWDVSQVGFIFAAKNEWRLSKSAKKVAAGYLETWNQYLSGDVWGYVIEDDEGNALESCWGFYGREYAEEQAKEVLASIEKRSFMPAI